MKHRPIGQIIDSLGVTTSMPEEDVITDVIVVAKVIDAAGAERVSVLQSEGLGFVTRQGMISIVHTSYTGDLATNRDSGE